MFGRNCTSRFFSDGRICFRKPLLVDLKTMNTEYLWSTEKKYMRGCKGTFDIFSGIEHRMMRTLMEEQFNKEARQDWREKPVQQESPTGMQAVRIASTLRDEFLWQSTGI